MSGDLNSNVLKGRIYFEGLPDRLQEWDRILDIHFVLKSDVIEFVDKLPERIRRISTKSEHLLKTYRGEIRGTPDWNATIKERYSRNFRDKSLFCCQDKETEYDIAENIILKFLLKTIYENIREFDEFIKRNYDWIEDWDSKASKREEKRIRMIRRIFERNIHIDRIKAVNDHDITPKLIHQAKQSRKKLYRDAAKLVKTYRNIKSGKDETEINELLENTMIIPGETSRLFELYVLFRIIDNLEELDDFNLTMKTIEQRKQEIAEFIHEDQELNIKIYHDTSGDLYFYPKIPKKNIDQNRYQYIENLSKKIMEDLFPDSSRTEYTGRPDILLIEIDSEDNKEFLIIELKYTKRKKYIHQGIKELLWYIAFMRESDDKEKYVFEERFPNGYKSQTRKDILGETFTGLLVTNDLETDYEKIDSNRLKVLQVKDLDTAIPKILKRKIYMP